jgi:hypothetical protein
VHLVHPKPIAKKEKKEKKKTQENKIITRKQLQKTDPLSIYQWPVPLPPRGFPSAAQGKSWPGSR